MVVTSSSACRDCSSALSSTLQLYRKAAGMIGADQLKSMTAADADAAIRVALSKSSSLHPAFSTPSGQYQTCRCLADAVLMQILPAEDRACPMLRSMLRELFATCLIRSILTSLAPYTINKVCSCQWLMRHALGSSRAAIVGTPATYPQSWVVSAGIRDALISGPDPTSLFACADAT